MISCGCGKKGSFGEVEMKKELGQRNNRRTVKD